MIRHKWSSEEKIKDCPVRLTQKGVMPPFFGTWFKPICLHNLSGNFSILVLLLTNLVSTMVKYFSKKVKSTVHIQFFSNNNINQG